MSTEVRCPGVLAVLVALSLLVGGGCRGNGGTASDADSTAQPQPQPVSEPAVAPTAPPDRIMTEKEGAVMVYVPAGEFLMGTSDADIERYRELFALRPSSAFDDERPQRRVYLDAFYIDQHEVTNRQYNEFLRESGYVPLNRHNSPPHDDPALPVVVFAWEDAVAYAEWVGKRLPTEAEWEKAARGTDGRIWPWGDEWDPTILSGNDGTGVQDGYVQTAPVGQFPEGASPYGALDMAGNLWEWVSDWYDPQYYAVAPDRNPPGPETGDGRVLRGGGWAESFDFTRCANRQRGADAGSLLRSFRCVLDVP